MLTEILISIIVGSVLGIFTGIMPGIHINLVAVILLSIAPILSQSTDITFIAIAIVAMSIVHTFLDIIPSTFLGAPDENNIMSALPAHKLLLQGKGFVAVKLATVGSFLGLVLVIALLPLMVVAIPFIFEFLKNYIGIILIVIMLFMILKEEKKFWSFFVFSISGIFGIIVFSLNLKDPLFPMFSGIFGVSTLLMSLSQKVSIPEQIIKDEPMSRWETIKATIAGTFSGALVSIFPGLGPAQAAILGGGLVGKIKEETYLILVGAIGTVSMVLSLITLYTINKARNGSIVVVQKLLGVVDMNLFLILMAVALIAGCVGVLLTMFFVRIFSSFITKVNYSILCLTIIFFVISLVISMTGWIGLYVLIVATAIGMIPELVGVGKNHAMGALLLPVILYFLL